MFARVRFSSADPFGDQQLWHAQQQYRYRFSRTYSLSLVQVIFNYFNTIVTIFIIVPILYIQNIIFLAADT